MNTETSTDPAGQQMTDLTERQARWALIGLIAVSTLGFSLLAHLRYASFNNFAQDTAQIAHAFHQTLQGRWFRSFVADYTLFGAHPDFLLLLWLPGFWLWPGPNTLFVLQSLTLSLAAWPAYLLARQVTGNRLTALIAAAALLLFPPVARVHVADIHDDPLGFAPLLFALYFFEKRSFKWFAVSLAVSLLAKETIVLNTVLFSVYALLRRRDWRWVTFPAVWSVGYFLLLRYVVMPLCGDWWGGPMYKQTKYFMQWGNTPGEVLRTMLTHPGLVLQTLGSADRVGYLVNLLQPLLLVLPFGSWAWVTALPALAVNLLGDRIYLRAFTHWYGLLLGGQLWASFVLALPFWSRRLAAWFGGRDYSRNLCVVMLLLCLTQCHLWFNPTEYQKSPVHQARLQAIAQIPRGASVLCTDNLLPAFTDRPSINSLAALHFYGQDANRIFDYGYIIFDDNFPVAPDEETFRKKLFLRISTHPTYRAIFEKDRVFVFQRVGTPERTLTW